jgi:hypothetical protein
MSDEQEELIGTLWRIVIILSIAAATAIIVASCAPLLVDYTKPGETTVWSLRPQLPGREPKLPPENGLLPPLLQYRDETGSMPGH